MGLKICLKHQRKNTDWGYLRTAYWGASELVISAKYNQYNLTFVRHTAEHKGFCTNSKNGILPHILVWCTFKPWWWHTCSSVVMRHTYHPLVADVQVSFSLSAGHNVDGNWFLKFDILMISSKNLCSLLVACWSYHCNTANKFITVWAYTTGKGL
jgi:hypothetical protein